MLFVKVTNISVKWMKCNEIEMEWNKSKESVEDDVV